MTPRDVLGVEPGADEAEVRAAFRAAVKRTHPDRGGTAEAFREVQWAWETLMAGFGDDGVDAVQRQETTEPNEDVRRRAAEYDSMFGAMARREREAAARRLRVSQSRQLAESLIRLWVMSEHAVMHGQPPLFTDRNGVELRNCLSVLPKETAATLLRTAFEVHWKAVNQTPKGTRPVSVGPLRCSRRTAATLAALLLGVTASALSEITEFTLFEMLGTPFPSGRFFNGAVVLLLVSCALFLPWPARFVGWLQTPTQRWSNYALAGALAALWVLSPLPIFFVLPMVGLAGWLCSKLGRRLDARQRDRLWLWSPGLTREPG